MHPKFTGVRTHDLQIITAHFMSLHVQIYIFEVGLSVKVKWLQDTHKVLNG